MGESLKDHIAVVTGATSGVGRAIARALSSHGAALCLVGRNEERLSAVAAEVGARTARVGTYVTDLSLDDQVQRLVDDIGREHTQVDIVVHSAGIFARGLIGEASVTELDDQYRTNLRAPYLLTARLLPLFRPERGQIVFVNSTAGLNASGSIAAYGSMKHALKAVADALREEVNARGIRVSSVFIGRTATPMQKEVHRLEGKPYRPERLLQPADVATIVLYALCMPRTAEVTDITIRPLAKP
jgi:NADP-dependent 3-hydroxy acid dehydrogenase YdfG